MQETLAAWTGSLPLYLSVNLFGEPRVVRVDPAPIKTLPAGVTVYLGVFEDRPWEALVFTCSTAAAPPEDACAPWKSARPRVA